MLKIQYSRFVFWFLTTGLIWGLSPGFAQLSLKQALEIRRPENLAISADGLQVAYVVLQARLEPNDYHSELRIMPIAGGSPRVIAEAEKIACVSWSADGSHLFYLAKQQNRYQAWRIAADGRAPAVQITHYPAGVAGGMADERVNDYEPFQISPDGQRAIYFARDTIAAARQAEAQLDSNFQYTDEMVASMLGDPRRLTDLQPAARSELWCVDLETGEERKIWTDEESAAGNRPVLFRWSPDNKYVAAFANPLTYKPKVLQILAVSNWKPIKVISDRIWMSGLTWSQDSLELSFNTMGSKDDPQTKIGLLHWEKYSLRDEKISRTDIPPERASVLAKQIEDTMRELVYDCVIAKPQGVAVAVRESAARPPELVSYSLDETGRPLSAKVLDPINPELVGVPLGEVQPYKWKRENGETGTSGLILPLGYIEGRRYPVVVMLYNQYSPRRFAGAPSFSSYAPQAFAAHGYVVVLANLPKNEWDFPAGEFATAVTRHPERTVMALRATLDDLIARGVADEKRMGIMGWSWGGFYSPYILTRYPDWFQVGAAGDATNHQPSVYWLQNDVMREQERSYFGGGPYGEWAVNWKQISPILNLDRLKAPLLLEYSSLYLSGIEFSRAIAETGGQAELHVYPREEHIIRKPSNRIESMQRHLDWFNFWLLGEEDAKSEKRDQYARWRKLRELHDADLRRRTPEKPE